MIWWSATRLCRALQLNLGAPLILGYHRITSPRPPGATSPTLLADHIDLLKARAVVLPLSELLERVENGRARPRELAITFDDGYRDQGAAARRLLEAGLPSTIFIPTAFPGSDRSFFWEGRSESDAEAIKARLRRGEEAPQGLAASDLMSWEEIAELARSGVVFESHTQTHALLAGLADDRLREELTRSREILTERLGKAPSIIAYPNGDWHDFDARTGPAARAAGYRWGCTAVWGSARAVDLPWRVRRVLINETSVADLDALITAGGPSTRAKHAADRLRRRR